MVIPHRCLRRDRLVPRTWRACWLSPRAELRGVASHAPICIISPFGIFVDTSPPRCCLLTEGSSPATSHTSPSLMADTSSPGRHTVTRAIAGWRWLRASSRPCWVPRPRGEDPGDAWPRPQRPWLPRPGVPLQLGEAPLPGEAASHEALIVLAGAAPYDPGRLAPPALGSAEASLRAAASADAFFDALAALDLAAFDLAVVPYRVASGPDCGKTALRRP